VTSLLKGKPYVNETNEQFKLESLLFKINKELPIFKSFKENIEMYYASFKENNEQINSINFEILSLENISEENKNKNEVLVKNSYIKKELVQGKINMTLKLINEIAFYLHYFIGLIRGIDEGIKLIKYYQEFEEYVSKKNRSSSLKDEFKNLKIIKEQQIKFLFEDIQLIRNNDYYNYILSTFLKVFNK